MTVRGWRYTVVRVGVVTVPSPKGTQGGIQKVRILLMERNRVPQVMTGNSLVSRANRAATPEQILLKLSMGRNHSHVGVSHGGGQGVRHSM